MGSEISTCCGQQRGVNEQNVDLLDPKDGDQRKQSFRSYKSHTVGLQDSSVANIPLDQSQVEERQGGTGEGVGSARGNSTKDAHL